jgi:hypothetical protein
MPHAAEHRTAGEDTLLGSGRDGVSEALSLGEDHEGVGVDPVLLHRFGCRLCLHELLKRGKVGDLDDHPHAFRSLGILERASGDSKGAENLFALG